MRRLMIPMLLALVAASAAAELRVGDFSGGALQPWQTKVFEGETGYRLVEDEGRTVLRADSDGTASGLYREIEVDLTETPYLNWSWKVAGVLEGIDERTRAGDDFPARVYVVVSGGALFWRTRSLVYVWASSQPAGSRWENPFTGNARHIAVQSGPGRVGQWVQEKRNLRQDWQALFGETIDRIDAVALMTDTDNSDRSATAWYGDIWFSAE